MLFHGHDPLPGDADLEHLHGLGKADLGCMFVQSELGSHGAFLKDLWQVDFGRCVWQISLFGYSLYRVAFVAVDNAEGFWCVVLGLVV